MKTYGPAVLAVVLSSCSSQANVALPPASNAHVRQASGSPLYSEKVLYDFTSPGYGTNYVSPLTPDGHGDYFGTTAVGGSGHGTVYELMPKGKGGWKASTLYSFSGGSDGGTPGLTSVILDKNGDLYGVTHNGGSNNDGVAYELQHSGHAWSERVIWTFGTGSVAIGDHPFSFIADAKGNFFGTVNTTQSAGWTEAVFELSPTASGWTAKDIFVDGIPSATSGGGGLTIDASENIFGVSSLAFQPSEVFELTPSRSAWSAKILYTFPRISVDPEAPPVLDKMGNIYGTTTAGGPDDAGTVYELMPSGSGPWKRKVLHAFTGGSSDGAAPFASVTFDGSGNIYGTTTVGGASNDGTVYELTASGRRYQSKLLWSFNGKDGSQPFVQVTLDARGDAFGTNTQGGPSRDCYALAGCGNAFEIK